MPTPETPTRFPRVPYTKISGSEVESFSLLLLPHSSHPTTTSTRVLHFRTPSKKKHPPSYSHVRARPKVGELWGAAMLEGVSSVFGVGNALRGWQS